MIRKSYLRKQKNLKNNISQRKILITRMTSLFE